MSPLKRHPILCNYYITTRCNARCSFCHIHKEKGSDADKSNILNNLIGLKKLGVRFIDFTGGEPLLYPHLEEILLASKKLGFMSTITTNCLLYPQYATRLRGLINFLHFSLDASEAKDHDEIRGVPCYDRVLESLDLADNLGEKPDILFTVSDSNVHHLHAMIHLAQKKKRMLLINPVFSYFGNPGIGQKALKMIQTVVSQPYVYVNRGILHLMKQNGNQIENPRCHAVTTTVVISPDNELVLPCFHKAVYRVPISGNVREAYNSLPVRRFTKLNGRYEFCRGCSISCYFDASFTKTLDDYFLLSQISKCKYIFEKFIRRNIGR